MGTNLLAPKSFFSFVESLASCKSTLLNHMISPATIGSHMSVTQGIQYSY